MQVQQRTYAVSHDQAAKMILAFGRQGSVMVEGDMGTGKSALLDTLGETLKDTHTMCYFDCTTKDVGDIWIPKFKEVDGQDYFTCATNAELGIHLEKPLVIMVDEYKKSNVSVKNALLRLVYEHKIGDKELHPDSIVFLTSNLDGEGLGDVLLPHQRNRMTRIRLRKPTHIEWVEWAQGAGIHYAVSSWVAENPQLFQSFEDVSPDDNQYIYHPERQQDAFVTPRSLEFASHWMHKADQLDSQSMEAALVGTLGPMGGSELFNYSKLMSDLPSIKDIKDSPTTARIPTGASATLMTVYRTLQNIERDWVDAWVAYSWRLPEEAKSYFLNGIRSPKHPKQAVVMNNAKFMEFADQHKHMFTADKRG